MATTSTAHPLRSLIALRYLETLTVTSGLQHAKDGYEGDLETFCRQFELCAAFLSQPHANSVKVIKLFLWGLPHAMLESFTLSRFGTISYTLEEMISAIRSFMEENALPGRRGRITRFGETGSIDRLLHSMEIKTHPKTDLDSNFAFENFHRMLKESTNDELSGKLEEFEPQGVQYTPSASSVADDESTIA